MPWIPSCAIADRVAIFSSDDAIDGKVEGVEVPQTAARGPFGICVVQPITWNEACVTFGDAAMGAQRTAAESRQIVRGGYRSDAGSASRICSANKALKNGGTMLETCVKVSCPAFLFCECADTKPPQDSEAEADYRFSCGCTPEGQALCTCEA